MQGHYECPAPEKRETMRSFLGAVGWNRRFIKDFSLKTRPLHDLTKKVVSFKWTTVCEKSFNGLKHAMITAPVLKPIDYGKKLILVTDASDRGLGGTLFQESDDTGQMHVVAYYSRSLNSHELA